MPPLPTIEIAPRFCGPPTSGNGGYVAGRLAAHLDADAVAVRLRIPPPLERELEVRVSGDHADLFDGETKVAEARAVDLDLEAPAPPGFEAAQEASRTFRGFEEHVFPGCFVCGTERSGDDGLCIYPGAHAHDGLFASPWVPDASLAGGASSADGAAREGDVIAPEFQWAALDCPGAFAFPQPEGQVVLLGEMQARLFGPVHVGERCVLTSWEVEHDGRKHLTGSALHGEDGAVRGIALGLWFEIDPARAPGSNA